MKEPEIPADEDTRIESLVALNVLDTPPEERFDCLTRTAMRALDVPIAVVSIVDRDRQWSKSIVGLPAGETPRYISFCGHAILQDKPLIVADTHEDERFFDNPLVINDPYLRFYAGIPLKSLGGEKLGTFCIIDRKPRTISKEEIEVLNDFAFMAERELSIVHLATIDDLTKISNRRGFMTLAKHSLKICQRHALPVTLIYFDLNNFKPINDKFGHSEGDKVLVAFSKILEDTVRESDVVGRLGGDEFVVLLNDATRCTAEEFLPRFQERIDEYNNDNDLEYSISFSNGIVEYSSFKHQSLKEMLREGDELMYDAKKQRICTNSPMPVLSQKLR